MDYLQFLRNREQTGKRHVTQRVHVVKLTVFETNANGQHTEKKIKEGYVRNLGSVFDQIASYLPFPEWDQLIFRKPNSADKRDMTRETIFMLYFAPAKANEYLVVNKSKEEINVVKKNIDSKRLMIFSDHYFEYELALYKKHSC